MDHTITSSLSQTKTRDRKEKKFRGGRSASKHHEEMKIRLTDISESRIVRSTDTFPNEPPPKQSFNKINSPKSMNSDYSEDDSDTTEIRYVKVKAKPGPRAVAKFISTSALAVEKELDRNKIIRGKTAVPESLQELTKVKDSISDYYYKPPKAHRQRLSKKEWREIHFATATVTPLLLFFLYEYFLGSDLANTMFSLASSRTLILLELVQYIPLIINIQQYKMIGDIHDISYCMHFYYHFLCVFFEDTNFETVVHGVLALQLIYVVHLIWSTGDMTSKEVFQVVRSSTIVLSVAIALDVTLGKFLRFLTVQVLYRSFVLILLQSVRYLPQIAHNNSQKHCAVESLESHLLSMLPALGKIYLAIYQLDIATALGYGSCFAGNATIAYQILAFFNNTTAYMSRKNYLKSKLPNENSYIRRRSVSLKFKPAKAREDLETESDDGDSRTVFSENKPNENNSAVFDHGPMI